MQSLTEYDIADIMRQRVSGILGPFVASIDIAQPRMAYALRVCVENIAMGVCSGSDVLACVQAAHGVAPVGAVCDMHTTIGHRALMKLLAQLPTVAKACGLDTDHPINDPVVLAQAVVGRLAKLDPLRRNRFLILFAQEHERVADAAGRAARDALMELAA